MESVKNLCKLLIQKGRTDGLMEKMDVYLAADRLTAAEYEELVGLMEPETVEEPTEEATGKTPAETETSEETTE